MPKSLTNPRTPQVISASESYSVAEFKLRTGVKDFAFRQARQAGLKVIEVGRKRFIRGVDWLAFLDSHASDAPPADITRKV